MGEGTDIRVRRKAGTDEEAPDSNESRVEVIPATEHVPEVHNPIGKSTEVNIIRLDKLVAGEDNFQSDGFSVIKITKGTEITYIEIPVKSTGITELVEALQRKRPKAPIKRELIFLLWKSNLTVLS